MVWDLPDVNVWLALNVPDHPSSKAAVRYWRDEASAGIAFCRVTTMGLVRLLSNRVVMDQKPLNPTEAWGVAMTLLEREGVALHSEPVGVDDVIGSWVENELVRPADWTDAYLAAFAVCGSYRLVTFHRDFERDPECRTLKLRA